MSLVVMRDYCYTQEPIRTVIRPPGTVVPEGLMFHAVKLRWVRFRMQVQKFGSPSLKNFLPSVRFGSISLNFWLWSRIFPERVKISKIEKTC